MRPDEKGDPLVLSGHVREVQGIPLAGAAVDIWHPAAVVLSVEDLESLEETLDVMGSAALLDDIRAALRERAAADPVVLSKDDALRLITDQ
jgi:hypothetical protein